MRTENDICLLCKNRKSNNTQSHIVPRFISKSIFIKGGFILDTGNADKPPTPTQDSAKEDYILCVECEAYFEKIETYIAARIQNRLRAANRQDDFDDKTNGSGLRLKQCLAVNPWIFRLFIYSIIWRCSISNTRVHKDFKLSVDEEEILRNALNQFYSATQPDLLENIKKADGIVPIVPFIFFTSDYFTNTTKNVIATSPFTKNPYFLQLNEYILVLSFNDWPLKPGFDFLLNNENEDIKIGFLKEQLWLDINKDFLNMVSNLAIERTKEKGLPLYLRPEKK